MRIRYFIAETITNLKRNFLMSIAAISTVAISLLLLGGVLILGLIVGNMTLTWEAKVEVTAYLRDDITDNELQDLQRFTSELTQVEDVDYVSKAEAFEEFKELFKEQPELWEVLPEDALPASLRVKLFEADEAEGVKLLMEGRPGVDSADFGGEFIKRLLQVNSLLRTITFATSLILMTAAAALIANTIRVAIYARRDEIGIMKLVGATNWFIRIPFMLEGLFAALMGAIVAGGIVVVANEVVFARIANSDDIPLLQGIFSFSNGEIGTILLVLAAVGAGVGLVGSSMALRRFLEV